jgi:hypothetical protein
MDQSISTHGNISIPGLAETGSPKGQNRLSFLLHPANPQHPLVSGFFWASIASPWAYRYRSALDSHPIHDL